MRRRALGLVLPAAALSGAPWAQNRVRRIGVVWTAAVSERFRPNAIEALAKAGAVEGRDFVLLFRSADGDRQKLPQLARELIAQGAEIILSTGDGARHVLRATNTVPVVAFGLPDVAEVAAEGHRSRLVGVDLQSAALSVKRLELLSSCLPRGARVLVVAELRHREHRSRTAVDRAAAQLGLQLHYSWCEGAADLAAALSLARRIKAVGLFQFYGAVLDNLSGQLVNLAAEARLADCYEWPAAARQGGLIAYGPDRDELNRQFYAMAWRVLQGAKPDSLPFEGPMRIHLALNLARAKALGLRVPPTLLARADEVIE